MNEFEEKFKSFDNRKLLKIVEESAKYQEIAVDAAKIELSKRKLSEDEVQAIKDEFLEEKIKAETRKEKFQKIENNAKYFGTEFFKTIHPLQNEHQSLHRKVNLIVIIFGALAIYQIFKERNMFVAILSFDLSEWDFSMPIYFFPIIILPFSIYFFWKRSKIGWMLFTSYVIYNLLNGIGMLYVTLQWMNQEGYESDSLMNGLQFEFTEMEYFIHQPNPMMYLLIIFFYGATLWSLNVEDIRTSFQIDNKTKLITFVVSFLLTTGMIGLII